MTQQVPNSTAQRLEKALSKKERTIPLLTADDVQDLHRDFMAMRSDFAAWCANRSFYNTLSLLSCCEIVMDASVPSIAGITNVDSLCLKFHPLILRLWKTNRHAAFLVFMHELRHLIQLQDFRHVQQLIDLSPIVDVLKQKQSQATDPDAIKRWQEIIDGYSDPKNTKVQKLKHEISNLTMDVALHEDVLKVFPREVEVNKFLKEEMVPYMTGNPLSEEERKNVHLQTVPTLGKVIGVELDRDNEWLYYCQEYVEWLARKQDENNPDPNNPPTPMTFEAFMQDLNDALDTLDEHEFGEGQESEQKREEAYRRVREAIQKAEEEGKVMAHKAGTTSADREIFGDPLANLNDQIKQCINLLRVKFARIWSPSPYTEYSFSRMHRLFPDDLIPGHIKPTQRKKSVALVMDVSGSMYSEKWINQMCAAANLLHKQGKLQSLWCCDTELHKVEFGGGRKYKVTGGGGTILDSSHATTILEDLKMKKNLDIVYLTDEQVDLKEISADKRINFHVVNIPDALEKKKK